MSCRPVFAACGLFTLVATINTLGPRPQLVGAAPADHPAPPPLEKAPPAAFECRWADTPIVLDGVADEPAWKHAQVIDAFHLPWLGDKARMARTATKARLLWDREYLYFFAEMEDTDLFAQVKEHDGDTWNDDVFELFFRPDRTKPGYYEFQVNAAGTVFDSFFPNRETVDFNKQKKLGAFHIDAKVKLRGTLNKRDDRDEGWAVEGRIPWTDFLRTGGRPEPGEQWAMNLCRYDYHKDWKEPELSCVAPVRERNFHQTEHFAALTFVGPRPLGIGKRESVTTSTVVGFPDPPPPYRVKRTADAYRPDYPIMVKHIPGTDQLLVITQPRAYAPTKLERVSDPAATGQAVKDAHPVLTTPGEGTAYDLTFHPKFAENGYVYVGWNGLRGWWHPNKMCFVTRYTMSPKPPYALDPGSARTIIAWESNGHNGAAVCFGTDGMLYVTSGDGTSDSDTNVTGQRTDLLLAKVLRIDVDHPAGGKMYGVPKDNPFVADPRFVPETWAYGLRNPWRICSDPKTGHIWVGQNGQDLWETAYFVRKGENYGWSVTEGSHPFYPERKTGPTPIVKPTVEHHHSEARSLTGGIVYHGEKFPDLKGAYLYGDYSTGHIWAVKHDGEKVVWHKKVAITPLKITAFSTDSKGELLICDHNKAGEGGFYTFEPNPAPKESTFPKKLSDSGLFDSVKGHKVKPGVIPYSVNAPFWSDGMHKERFIALPPGEGIEFTRSRGWNFPDKTVLVKSFALDETDGDPASRRWVETRFLTRQGGEWYGYSYLWNDAGTDATLIDAAGTDKEFTVRTAGGGQRKQVWQYPGRAECMVCHSRAQNYVLGLCEIQMNKDHDYGGGRVENQIRALERLGMFKVDWYAEVKGGVADPVNKPEPGQRQPKPSTLFTHLPADLKKLTNPYDKSADLTLRAKSWLHANCSSCHVEAGGGNALMELEFATALDKMRILDVKPVHQTFDLPDAKLVVPGAPERSVLLHRLGTRGPGQMPPLSTSRVDSEGLELMREWCRSLKK
ncbi:MAG: yliI 4 [Gemmataceae bacterium]|nr:yliI 4 [Gemmataceae bacterium]